MTNGIRARGSPPLALCYGIILMRLIAAFSETKRMCEWVLDSRCRVSQPVLSERLRYGWHPERAISEAPAKGKGRRKCPVNIGDCYNRLTLIRHWREKLGKQQASKGEFLCKCGAIVNRWVSLVKSGHVKSCGCLNKEQWAARVHTQGRTHGLSNHRLYRVHRAILRRCYNGRCASYPRYGGKGIDVCIEWRNDFLSFFHWAMDAGWQLGMTIERKDNSKGYHPRNCMIASYTTQANNKSNNRIIVAFGEEKTLSAWSRDSRAMASYATIWSRISILGWESTRAIITPSRKIGKRKKSG